MSTVLIKQIPDDYADSTGLAKYNRSRMPGCRDRFSPAQNPDGRYVTGLDEESFIVKTEAEREKIKAERLSLQKMTGKDLTGVSPFWETYQVTLYSDQPKMFNTANPMDKIALSVLIANCNVAPDKEAAYTPLYRDAQYYAYTEEQEETEEISVRKKRDTAIVELVKIQDSKDRLLLYGQYLEGLKYTDKLGIDTLYKMLRAYIEDKEIKNAGNFLEALKLSVEELQQKVIVDRAIKQRLISKVKTGKVWVYQYGRVTLGATLEEVYKNMTLPEFASDLMSLKKEVEK